jgi:hypothetical protein
MELAAADSALSAVKTLNSVLRALHEAVLASKRNDAVMVDIANTIYHRAPIIERLLLEIVHSDDAKVHRSFCHAITTVVAQMDRARLVVYTWLVKNPAARMVSAGDMELALKRAREVLDRSLADVQALEVHDTRDRAIAIQQGAMELQQNVVAYGAQVRAVAAQLESLLDGSGSDPAHTLVMAKFALKMSAKGGAKLKGHTHFVGCVAWSPDGTKVATASWDNTAALWDPVTGQRLHVFKGHTEWVNCVAWSPDGTQLATASSDKTAALLDPATGHRLRSLEGHTASIECVAWSPDGTKVATTSSRTAALWDPVTGRRLHTLEGHTDTVRCVAWSPDGTKVATTSDDKTAALWDPATGRRLCSLEGHTELVISVAWSPDCTKVATASYDNTAALWDPLTGQRLHVLKGHTQLVTGVAWSPDGTKVATASWDKTAALWDPVTGRRLRSLEGHTSLVVCVAWSPDGTKVATSSSDYTAALP